MNKVILSQNAYERMIKELVFIDEHINDLVNIAVSRKSFSSAYKAQRFFHFYVKKVESIFKSVEIIENYPATQVNRLPFIIVGSYFMLLNEEGEQSTYQLTLDLETKDCYKQIYLLSKTGLELIFKKDNEVSDIDIGYGPQKYTVRLIKY